MEEKLKKSKPISINLSNEEKDSLEKKAQEQGLSTSAFIRSYLKKGNII